MRTFIVDSDNNITVFASGKQARASDATGAEAFTTQGELVKLASAWPAGRADVVYWFCAQYLGCEVRLLWLNT